MSGPQQGCLLLTEASCHSGDDRRAWRAEPARRREAWGRAADLVLGKHLRTHAARAPALGGQLPGRVHERTPHASPPVPLVHHHIQNEDGILRAHAQ